MKPVTPNQLRNYHFGDWRKWRQCLCYFQTQHVIHRWWTMPTDKMQLFRMAADQFIDQQIICSSKNFDSLLSPSVRIPILFRLFLATWSSQGWSYNSLSLTTVSSGIEARARVRVCSRVSEGTFGWTFIFKYNAFLEFITPVRHRDLWGIRLLIIACSRHRIDGVHKCDSQSAQQTQMKSAKRMRMNSRSFTSFSMAKKRRRRTSRQNFSRCWDQRDDIRNGSKLSDIWHRIMSSLH